MLEIEVDGEHQSVARGWINILTNDWENIIEKNDDATIVEGALPSHFKLPRITFAKSIDALGRNAYRFIGIYQLNDNNPRKSEIGVAYKKILKRIAQHIDLTPWIGKSD